MPASACVCLRCPGIFESSSSLRAVLSSGSDFNQLAVAAVCCSCAERRAHVYASGISASARFQSTSMTRSRPCSPALSRLAIDGAGSARCCPVLFPMCARNPAALRRHAGHGMFCDGVERSHLRAWVNRMCPRRGFAPVWGTARVGVPLELRTSSLRKLMAPCMPAMCLAHGCHR